MKPLAYVLLAMLFGTPAAVASDWTDYRFDQARVYFATWEKTYTLAMTPVRIKADPWVEATYSGLHLAGAIAARMAIDSREPNIVPEDRPDVRLLVEFLEKGKVVRSVYASDTALYDDRGPIHVIDEGFKDLFRSLEAPVKGRRPDSSSDAEDRTPAGSSGK